MLGERIDNPGWSRIEIPIDALESVLVFAHQSVPHMLVVVVIIRQRRFAATGQAPRFDLGYWSATLRPEHLEALAFHPEVSGITCAIPMLAEAMFLQQVFELVGN